MAKLNKRIIKKPKVAKRSQWVKKTARFLRLSLLVVVGVGALGSAGFYSIQVGQDFLNRPIAEVKINSTFHFVAEDTVNLLVEQMIGGSFVGENIDDIKAKLQMMPWIDSVNLVRQWPDRLVVNVKEQTPIARWADDSFINVRGELINIVDNDSLAHLSKLSGEKKEAQNIMQQYAVLASVFQTYGVSIHLLEKDRRGVWQLRLSNDWLVVLGRGDVFAKVQRLTHLLDKQLLEITAEIKVVDIRYSNGLAIEWLPQEKHNNETHAQFSAEQIVQDAMHKRG